MTEQEMLSKEEFVNFVLEGPEAAAPSAKIPEEAALPEGFDGFDDVETKAPAAEVASSFARRLLEASGFGYPELVHRSNVIRGTDSVARHLPERVSYWSNTPKRPYKTLLFEAALNHQDVLAIPAFKSRKIAHLEDVESALARMVIEALDGFQRGGEGVTADVRKGRKEETLCVVSIIDEREGEPVRLVCFGTQNKSTGGLETFQITEQTRFWERQQANDHLRLLYERQFKKLEGGSWQEAFTTTEERKQAEKLLDICTRKTLREQDIQEGVLDLLDIIAKGFGLRKPPNRRRLQAFELPSDHDIGIDPEERESSFGGKNPFGGVTLRDESSRLLGYIIYPLKTRSEANRLRKHLEKNNRFHNVLVVYPDEDQASLELWQGQEQLIGKLRKGQGYRDAADVVNLLSRFFVVSKARVRNPTELAQELAYRARYLRRLAVKQLEEEQEKGPLRELYKAFKKALVHDISEAKFADAYAQTITYCLLTARWMGKSQLNSRSERFTRRSALAHVPTARPFLNDFFKSALAVKIDAQRGRLLWLLDDIADLLDRIDVTFVFGSGDYEANTSTDPVIHFYEPFLDAYDRQLKRDLGVFYTPRPVVSFIVRSIDKLLRTQFGLADGLADTATWGEMAKRHVGLQIPNGIGGSQPFVQILDPATGTGTFLVEIINLIHETMVEKWKAFGFNTVEIARLWNEYVPQHLLPRLHGYELLMAPYAIAHLKVGLKLSETGYNVRPGDHTRIFLTNALEADYDFTGKFDFEIPVLAREAEAVSTIKRVHAFTVVVANPPYANYSANLTDEARAIVDKYRMFAGSPIRERNQLQFERNLQDDFVKFIAVGERDIMNAGFGVLGYITNATMLASSSLRGMREHLLRVFGSLYELHLHGGVNEIGEAAVNDQNVFDIAQAVAIHVYARPIDRQAATVKFNELWGTRSEKFAWLSTQSLTGMAWQEVLPDGENCAFVPQDGIGDIESVRVDDVFRQFGAGIKTNRDSVAIAFSTEELMTAVEDFAPRLAKSQKAKASIQEILYRPFDKRVIFYHEGVVASRSLPTMQHVLAGNNIGLVASSTWTSPERFSINASRMMVEMKTGTHDRGTTYFPLFRYESIFGGPARRVPNIRSTFCEQWERVTGTKIIPNERGDIVKTVGVRDVFDWIFGLCHSNEYRRRHRALLAQGFPLVFFPKQVNLLGGVVDLGKQLVEAYLLEETGDNPLPSFVGDRSSDVEKISYSDGTIWIDRKRKTGFRGISQDIWNLHVGGYPVCAKWLKGRKGRPLDSKEVAHYQEILRALHLILRLSSKVDKLVAEHGGWPAAFLTKATINKK